MATKTPPQHLAPTPTATAPVQTAAPPSAAHVEPGNRSLAKLFRAASSGSASGPELQVSSPTDPEEREAERVATTIMRSPNPVAVEPSSVTVTTVQRKCSACEDEEHKVHRSATGASPTTAPAAVHDVIQSPGQPLNAATRSFFEPRFGADLSSVRIHDNTAAAASANAVQAKAYTVGNNIAFASGQYAPESTSGKELLAHELTHVVQGHGGTQRLRRFPSFDDIKSSLGGAYNSVKNTVSSGIDAVTDTVQAGVSAVRSGVNTAVDAATRAGQAVVEGAQSAASYVSNKASQAVDWLATQAGRLAQRLAEAFGGSISITPAGLVVRLPEVCPIDMLEKEIELPSIERDWMVPLPPLPIGTFGIFGEVGLAGSLEPEMDVSFGPVCLKDGQILINPITDTYSISGAIEAPADARLAAEARGGIRGAVRIMGVIPIGGVPVPIILPKVGVEGGIAGFAQGTGNALLRLDGGLKYSGGVISLRQATTLDLSLLLELALGAYAQLDVEGVNLCRLYWQPYTWRGGMAGSLGVGVGVSLAPDSAALATVTTTANGMTFPIEQIPNVVGGPGFSDDCPIKDKLCDLLRSFNLLPSQNGGTWDNYGPGTPLAGPSEPKVYPRDPGIASGALCRGACGADCKTCTHHPVYTLTDPTTGHVWNYTNFEDCNTHAGCRDHDAGFDWAAADKGETGKWAMIMPWHMAANIECMCNHLAGNCIAWIAGQPPYDGKMYFAESVTEGTATPGTPTNPQPGDPEAPTPGPLQQPLGPVAPPGLNPPSINPPGLGPNITPPGLGPATSARPKIYVDPARYPESVKHIKEAFAAGEPADVTIDRGGARSRRGQSIRKYKSKYNCDGAGYRKPPCALEGQDYDEYPLAMFLENGGHAHVKPIDRRDNRGSGSSIGGQCEPYLNGRGVRIVIGARP